MHPIPPTPKSDNNDRHPSGEEVDVAIVIEKLNFDKARDEFLARTAFRFRQFLREFGPAAGFPDEITQKWAAKDVANLFTRRQAGEPR